MAFTPPTKDLVTDNAEPRGFVIPEKDIIEPQGFVPPQKDIAVEQATQVPTVPEAPTAPQAEGGGVVDYAKGALAGFTDVGYATLEGAAALLGQVTGDDDMARSVSDFRNYSKQFYAGDVPDETKEKLSYKVTETMGQLPAYVASGAAKVPGLIAMGFNAFQQGRDDYLGTQGVTTATATEDQITEANKVGGMTAVPMMLLEKYGAGKILNSVFKEGAELTAKEVGKRVLSSTLAEGATEGTQTALQNAIASKVMQYDEDRPLTRGVVESMLIGAIASGGLVAPTNAAMLAANKLSGGIQNGEINPQDMANPDMDSEGNPTLEKNLKDIVMDNPDSVPPVGSSKPKSIGFVKNAKDIVNRVVQPISSQVRRISPRLGYEWGKVESVIGIRTNKRVESVKPFVSKLKSIKKNDPQAYNRLAQVLFNGDTVAPEVRDKVLRDAGVFEEFADVRSVLGNSQTEGSIYSDAEKVGMKTGGNKQYFMGFLQDYFPRMVQDYDGLIKHYGQSDDMTMFDQEIAARERETGRKIDDYEKGILLESFIKGDMHQRVGANRPRSTMERRTATLDPGALQYYVAPEDALIKYVENMTTSIETKRFLGINDSLQSDGGRERVAGKMSEILQEEYAAGNMTRDKEAQIRDLVKARFGVKDAQNSIIAGAKNLGYLATMGNVGSAITQIADFAYTAFQNGILPSIRAATGEKVFRLEDIGVDRDQVTIEAQDGPKALRNAVDFVFKASGLTQLDRLAKETNINAAFRNAQKMARGKGQKVLRAELSQVMTPSEVNSFIADLKEGKPTERVGVYLFHKLAEVAPISLSEMPPAYAANPNWRILYQLKSYTVKQLDFIRNKSISKITSGISKSKSNPKQGAAEVAEGLKNLVKISTVLMAANASADVIKDFIFGREIDPEDIAIDNMLRIFGVNRYVASKARKDPANALTNLLAPPQVNIASDIWKDAIGSKDLDDLRTMKYVPFVGKFYYWHEGRGKEMAEKYKWSE